MAYKTDSSHHRTITRIFAEEGGSMSQHRFDVLFSEYGKGRHPALRGGIMQSWAGDDTIYGMGIGNIWLEMLQHAVADGHASQEGKVGSIIYHVPPKKG